MRASWYTAPILVLLRSVGPRCVGLARKISAHCNTGSYVFSFFFIFIFILFPALSHMYVILIPSARSLKVGYEKSILTRTENFSINICFLKEPLLFMNFFLKRMCFYLLFPLEHETRSVKFFCFVTPKSCVCNNINWEIKSNSARKIRNFSFLINFTSHAIKRRQHSIERDVDLHVIIECLRKNADTLRPKEANNHRDLQIILKLLFSRQHEQRAWIIPTESLRVTQQMLA